MVTPQFSSSFRQKGQTSAGMETFLTKTMTIVALICFLVVGAAATAIIGRDSIPAARLELASASAPLSRAPVSNKENKKDRLAVVSYALAAYEPPQTTAALSEPLRQAYASTAPADIGLPKEVAPAARMRRRPLLRRSPRLVAKPQPQKNYALLSDVQIAGIKERLKLSSVAGIRLAAGGNRVARRRPQDSCGPAGQPECCGRADRSRIRGSPAVEIGGDAAAVPVA